MHPNHPSGAEARALSNRGLLPRPGESMLFSLDAENPNAIALVWKVDGAPGYTVRGGFS